MKRRISFFLALLLLPALLLANAPGASGAEPVSRLTIEDLQGGFSVSPGSEYTDTDLFSGFRNLVPGDVRTQKIQIRNQCRERTGLRLFLRTRSHGPENPLSPPIAAAETPQSNRDFLSRLTLRVWVRNKLVYAGDPENAFTESVFLGELPWGRSLDLQAELSVPVTLDNTGARRLGELDWVISAEQTADRPNPTGDIPPRTGDRGLLALPGLLAGPVLCWLYLHKKVTGP